MDSTIMRLTFSDGCTIDCRVAVSFTGRLKGLLGTHADDQGDTALLLAPCSSVHTWGMAYDLDLLFLGDDGHVMAAYRGVRPRSVRTHRHAAAVVERAASARPWPQTDALLVLAEGVFEHTVSEHE